MKEEIEATSDYSLFRGWDEERGIDHEHEGVDRCGDHQGSEDRLSVLILEFF